MLTVRRMPAPPALRGVISGFTERRGHFAEMSQLRPLPARPVQILEIYLAECYRVKKPGDRFGLSPEAVLVGPMTRPGVELGFYGTIETFTVHFTPTGLSRLFGVPMDTLADEAAPVGDVIGAAGRPLIEAVRRQERFEARIASALRWAESALEGVRPAGAVDRAAILIGEEDGRTLVDQLARAAGLSPRQLQRRFTSEVGVAPKHYARLCRMAGVIRARNAAPQRTLIDLAHDFGFADQAHLSREFRALSGRNPSDFFRAVAAVPETAGADDVRFVQGAGGERR